LTAWSRTTWHGAERAAFLPKINDGYGYPLRGVFLPFWDREGIARADHLSNRVLDRLTSELLEKRGMRGVNGHLKVPSFGQLKVPPDEESQPFLLDGPSPLVWASLMRKDSTSVSTTTA
jgi:hypothetical protein